MRRRRSAEVYSFYTSAVCAACTFLRAGPVFHGTFVYSPAPRGSKSWLATHIHRELCWIPQYLGVNISQNLRKSLVISDHLSSCISHWTSIRRKGLQEAQSTQRWQIGHLSPSLNRHAKWRQPNITDRKSLRRSSTRSDQSFAPEALSPAEATKISSQEKINNPVTLPSTLQQTVSSGSGFAI